MSVASDVTPFSSMTVKRPALKSSTDRARTVVTPEVEAIEDSRHVIECTLDLRRERRAPVEKQGAAAMVAEVTEGHDLTGRRNLVQSHLLATQVKAGHAQAAAVVEDQALERPVAISEDEGSRFSVTEMIRPRASDGWRQ